MPDEAGQSTPDLRNDGEHPAVVMRDIATRPKPPSHIITFANEKGGVGKSTLAFHCAVSLAYSGQSVAVIDLDRRQQTLGTALTGRLGTARNLQIELPQPVHSVLSRQSGAMLYQEIARIGSDADFVIIDAAGHDSATMRRAIAMADTLVTPINCSLVDLDMLGRLDPVTMRLRAPGQFAGMVEQLRAERAAFGMGPSRWVVVRNRMRTSEKRQRSMIGQALDDLSARFDFEIAEGLRERVAYRELFLFGLTYLDLAHIPGLGAKEPHAQHELEQLLLDLSLNVAPRKWQQGAKANLAPISKQSAKAYSRKIAGYCV